jgi:hypothetical protein
VSAGVLNLAVAVLLENFGQFPAAVEAGEAPQLSGKGFGGRVHMGRLSI